MAPARVALALAVIVVASVASGCLAGENSGGGPPLELSVAPAEARVGDEPATFTITLTVRESVTIRHPGCPPELLSARVALGGLERDVFLYSYGEEPTFGACALQERTLEPGTYARVVSWNGHLDPDAPQPHSGPRAPAGTYAVVASLRDLDRNLTAEARAVVAPA